MFATNLTQKCVGLAFRLDIHSTHIKITARHLICLLRNGVELETSASLKRANWQLDRWLVRRKVHVETLRFSRRELYSNQWEMIFGVQKSVRPLIKCRWVKGGMLMMRARWIKLKTHFGRLLVICLKFKHVVFMETIDWLFLLNDRIQKKTFDWLSWVWGNFKLLYNKLCSIIIRRVVYFLVFYVFEEIDKHSFFKQQNPSA